jgi:hypothetical protein
MEGLITWRGFHERRRNAPVMVDSVSMRKTWAVSGLLSSGRVGSIDGEIKSTTWVSFSKGRMGSTSGNGSTVLVLLSEGRAGLIEEGIGSTTLSTGSTKDVTILMT